MPQDHGPATKRTSGVSCLQNDELKRAKRGGVASRRDQRGSRYDVNGRILEIERDGVAEGGRRNCKPNEPKLRTPGSPNLFLETGVGELKPNQFLESKSNKVRVFTHRSHRWRKYLERYAQSLQLLPEPGDYEAVKVSLSLLRTVGASGFD